MSTGALQTSPKSIPVCLLGRLGPESHSASGSASFSLLSLRQKSASFNFFPRKPLHRCLLLRSCNFLMICVPPSVPGASLTRAILFSLSLYSSLYLSTLLSVSPERRASVAPHEAFRNEPHAATCTLVRHAACTRTCTCHSSALVSLPTFTRPHARLSTLREKSIRHPQLAW